MGIIHCYRCPGSLGHFIFGIGVLLLAFDCFLRVSELCNIRKEHFADSGDHRISTDINFITFNKNWQESMGSNT
jgi:hypothetical protein